MKRFFATHPFFWAKSLKYRYLIGLGTIAILAILGQVLIQMTLYRHSLDNEEIQRAESLVVQSREQGKLALQIQMSPRSFENDSIFRKLKSNFQEFEKNHVSLKQGDPSSGSKGVESPEVKKHFEVLDPLLASMHQNVDQLLAKKPNLSSNKKNSYETLRLSRQLMGSEFLYRTEMDKLANFYEKRSGQRIYRLKVIESLLLGLTLLTLILEGFFIFRPAITKLKETVKDLEQSEARKREILEQSLKEKAIAEEKLKKAATSLERSNEALEQFAYIASHDLQEPLRMVSLYVGLLAKKCESHFDAEASQYVEQALDGTKRMKQMIVDLLNYSLVGTSEPKKERVNTLKLVQEILTLVQPLVEETKTQFYFSDLPEVRGDRSQLVHLFQNLITNAIKFRGDKPPEIHIRAQPQGEQWLFTFKDNGIGLDMSQCEMIFDAFKRLHPKTKYPGTGLGLAISKKIVESHGGKIWAESSPGQGTTFFFTLNKTFEKIEELPTVYKDRKSVV